MAREYFGFMMGLMSGFFSALGIVSFGYGLANIGFSIGCFVGVGGVLFLFFTFKESEGK